MTKQTTDKNQSTSRCMKILKAEFMDELRVKYGAQQVDQAVAMD
jgi:hypothetical protein